MWIALAGLLLAVEWRQARLLRIDLFWRVRFHRVGHPEIAGDFIGGFPNRIQVAHAAAILFERRALQAGLD